MHKPLTVRIKSFSYKYDRVGDQPAWLDVQDPHGGGFIFDCRSLPNPGRNPANARKTGLDPEVIAELDGEPSVEEFYFHARSIVVLAINSYLARGFESLSVAFGCTGGQHRSTFCAERLARDVRQSHAETEVQVELQHVGLKRLGLLP